VVKCGKAVLVRPLKSLVNGRCPDSRADLANMLFASAAPCLARIEPLHDWTSSGIRRFHAADEKSTDRVCGHKYRLPVDQRPNRKLGA